MIMMMRIAAIFYYPFTTKHYLLLSLSLSLFLSLSLSNLMKSLQQSYEMSTTIFLPCRQGNTGRERLYKQIMGNYQFKIIIVSSFHKQLYRYILWIMYSAFVMSHLYTSCLGRRYRWSGPSCHSYQRT